MGIKQLGFSDYELTTAKKPSVLGNSHPMQPLAWELVDMTNAKGCPELPLIARCQLHRRPRCLTNFVTHLILTIALVPLSC